MRIIAGAARGIPLKAGKSEAVRPTTDRIKESLFNMLGPMHNLCIIDLFAGSGSLGLEALSRGASSVYFVENDRLTCKTIDDNLKKISKALGPEIGNTRVLNADANKAARALPQLADNIDIILADPPYTNGCILAKELLENKKIAEWARGSLLVLEHTKEMRPPENSNWEQIRRKDYGLTVITFWKQKADNE